MKVGKFEESLVSIKKSFELLEQTKEDFKGDIYVVTMKFFALQSNIYFILKNYKESLASANQGLSVIDSINSNEATIINAVKNVKRDLTNNMVRSTAKLESKPAS